MIKTQGIKQKQIDSKFKRLKVIVALFALFLIPGQVSALTLDQQISEAQKKLNQKTTEKKTIQGEVAYFDGQIGSIQAQINKTNAEISRLQKEVKATEESMKKAEADLAKAREQLGEVMRTIYEEGELSGIEVVASSSSFSEYVNRSEYLESINLKIKEVTNEVLTLKRELEAKKISLENNKKNQEKLRSEQLEQRRVLSTQKTAKDNLLAVTKGQEGQYSNYLKYLLDLRRQESERNNEKIGGGGSGSYPYLDKCGAVDPWKFYYCQCTSYASWRWNSWGKRWTNSRPGNGNAWNWPALASDQGYTVSRSPQVGAIAVWPISSGIPYGHVAIVTGVNGGSISVSEYNWSISERYGTRSGIDYSARNLQFIY